MYVFHQYTEDNLIDSVLGTSTPPGDEYTQKIIFMLGSKIVLSEYYECSIEHEVDGQVYFDINDNKMSEEYYPSNAIFNAKKKESHYGCQYYLTSIK